MTVSNHADTPLALDTTHGRTCRALRHSHSIYPINSPAIDRRIELINGNYGERSVEKFTYLSLS